MALATSTSTDPVQTIVDLLSNTVSGDYPNGTKPDPIEKHWDSQYREKVNRDGVAAYVRSPETSSTDQLSVDADTKVQMERVNVQVWGNTEADVVNAAGDVEAILQDYHNDRGDNTAWSRIRVLGQDDRRQEETRHPRGKHVVAVEVRLRREASMGTGR